MTSDRPGKDPDHPGDPATLQRGHRRIEQKRQGNGDGEYGKGRTSEPQGKGHQQDNEGDEQSKPMAGDETHAPAS